MSAPSRNKIDNHRVMIDLETLGVRTTSIIIAIAAVVFKDDTPVEVYSVNVAVAGQEDAGLTRDQSTLDFWDKPENREVFKTFAINAIPLYTTLVDLAATIRLYQLDQFWAKGPDFDLRILENAYRALHLESEIPWKHYQMRDVRTVEKYLNEKKSVDEIKRQSVTWREQIARDYKQTICKHNPLYDCYFQMLTVVAFEKMLAPQSSSEKNVALVGVRKLKLEVEGGSVVLKTE